MSLVIFLIFLILLWQGAYWLGVDVLGVFMEYAKYV